MAKRFKGKIAPDIRDSACGLTLAGVLSLDRLDDDVMQRLREVVDGLDTAARAIRDTVLRVAVRAN